MKKQEELFMHPPKHPILSILVAKAKNNVIGIQNKLPWHLSSELKQFKKRTLGKPILMGRKTWESLGKALPGRPNLVLTSDPNYQADSAIICQDFKTMLEKAQNLAHALNVSEYFVIGGEALYRLALEIADKIYLTEVNAEVKGDRFFPEIKSDLWMEIERTAYPKTEKDAYGFVIKTFIKR